MTECGTCRYKGETVSGEHCGRCVKQNDSPTQYAPYDEVERLRGKVKEREQMIEWALKRISSQKRELDALTAYIRGESCESCRWMNEDEDGPHCGGCIHNAKDCYQPMTNHDHLRMMTTNEFARWLDQSGLCFGEECPDYEEFGCKKNCVKRVEEWLSQPVENQRSESHAAL